MDITIVGGAGFVGSNLADILKDKEDVSVTVADLNPKNPAKPISEDVERQNMDVTDSSTINFEGADVVVHLVALTPLNSSERAHQKVHVEGTANIVEAAEEKDVERFIHMSALGADPEGQTSYIRAKGQAERYVRESNLDYAIFRPSVIFGRGDELVSGMMEAVGMSRFVPIPSQVPELQPLYVKDVAEMISDAAVGDIEMGNIFEIGGPEQMDLKEMFEKVYSSFDAKPYFLSIPMPMVFVFLAFLELMPFTQFGLDQYRFLRMDNVVDDNDIRGFGLYKESLTTFEEFLEIRKISKGVKQ